MCQKGCADKSGSQTTQMSTYGMSAYLQFSLHPAQPSRVDIRYSISKLKDSNILVCSGESQALAVDYRRLYCRIIHSNHVLPVNHNYWFMLSIFK